MRQIMCLLHILCICLYICQSAGRSVDIFSDEEKENCENARREYLTPTDRIMKNMHVEDVRKIVLEGDMVLSPAQKARWSKTGYLKRNIYTLIKEKWPGNTIKYQFTSPSPDKSMVIAAMKEWSKKTCMKFVEDTGNVLSIFKGTGCYAQVGYHSKNMQMSVGSLCDKGTVVHLLGHVIGLPHQHSRPDRDDFLQIQYHNTALEDVLYLNFKGYDLCPYDYQSVMHFDTYGLSYNGESVFLGKTEHEAEDGLMLSPTIGSDWSAPSDSDAALVNSEYGCPSKPCSARKPAPPACNQEVLATQAHFERIVTFKTLLTERSKAISCIWKTEVPETLPCSRAAISVTLADSPDNDLKRVWFASGCRLFHVEIFDPDADMSYFYCAAQFARNPSKVFVSTARKIYAIVRMYPVDWERFETTALDTGKVRFLNIKDFVCAGEINGKCF